MCNAFRGSSCSWFEVIYGGRVWPLRATAAWSNTFRQRTRRTDPSGRFAQDRQSVQHPCTCSVRASAPPLRLRFASLRFASLRFCFSSSSALVGCSSFVVRLLLVRACVFARSFVRPTTPPSVVWVVRSGAVLECCTSQSTLRARAYVVRTPVRTPVRTLVCSLLNRKTAAQNK